MKRSNVCRELEVELRCHVRRMKQSLALVCNGLVLQRKGQAKEGSVCAYGLPRHKAQTFWPVFD